jgi:ABC-type amino acid transport substrate-binding protein
MVYGPPLYEVRILAVMRLTDLSGPHSLSDIVHSNMVVLSPMGTATAAWLKEIPGIQLDDGAKSAEANLEKLLSYRGDIVIYHDLTLNYLLSQPKFAGKFRIQVIDFEHTAGLEREMQYLVYSRSVPKDIMDDINRIILQAEASGELKAITDKYLR